MWKKAQDLARDEEAIVKAPSEDHACKSYSNKRPHYVRKSKCGGFLCDDQCLSYKSMKLCSHTKCKPNFTTLVETGKPSTAGKKSIRRGVSKKNSKEIKEIVANAEDSDLKWKTRGVEQSDDDADYDSTIDQPSSSQLASASTPVSSLATGFIMSPRDVHSIQISGGIHTTLGSPPPLISAASMYSPSPRLPRERPCVETSFWLVFIFGNISRCNGCKGKICRDVNKKLLPPPDDIVLGHKKFVVFQNPNSGIFEQSREKRNVYYHPWLTCIAPHFRDFNPDHHIIISEAMKVKLHSEHKKYLENEFGISC